MGSYRNSQWTLNSLHIVSPFPRAEEILSPGNSVTPISCPLRITGIFARNSKFCSPTCSWSYGFITIPPPGILGCSSSKYLGSLRAPEIRIASPNVSYDDKLVVTRRTSFPQPRPAFAISKSPSREAQIKRSSPELFFMKRTRSS